MVILEISAKVLSTTFRNPDNGWSVIAVEETEVQGKVLVVGIFPPLDPGQFLKITGQWTTHARYGKQLQMESYELIVPEKGEALIQYLASGAFPGIGLATATRIVEKFGDETISILDSNSSKLSEIKGFKPKRLLEFFKAWNEAQKSRETFMFLQTHQISGVLASTIWKLYGSEAITTLTENPFVICENIAHAGFEKSDIMARNLGFSPVSPLRLSTAMLHTLRQASLEGHTYLPPEQLLNKSLKFLQLPPSEELEEHLQEALKQAVRLKKIVPHHQGYSFPQLANAENYVAKRIQLALRQTSSIEDDDHTHSVTDNVLHQVALDFMKVHKIEPNPEQINAMLGAIRNHIFVLTGGPGTGKTTSLRGILHLADFCNLSVMLAAPTGRAARRMSEITDSPAMTLHKMLGITPDNSGFGLLPLHNVDVDILVVDEFSMVDTWLTHAMFLALSPKTRLVIIGDTDQLPAIGPGNILRELLAQPNLPSITLKHTYRQQDGSDIAENAHRINEGHLPNLHNGTHFHFLPVEHSLEALHALKSIVTRADKHLSQPEIQVLTPMHRLDLGTQALNKHLQSWLNPNGLKIKVNGNDWRVGDRVMQLKNDYENDIFNGDVGIISDYRSKTQELIVIFDTRKVILSHSQAKDLSLAYACTVHKSQGSEYPGVIVILDSAHHNMLQRNLLYTAVTRAREHIWVIAMPGALETAVRTQRINRRYTRLSYLLEDSVDFMDWMDT